MTRLSKFIETLGSYSSRRSIECDGETYTYLDLMEEVDHWQDRFRQLDVQSGAVVGVRADYSLSSIAALISLLSRRALAALVPRDRAFQGYVQDCHAIALLDVRTDGSYDWQPIACETTHPLLDRMRAANEGGLVVFTSGSTGRPKAALQSTERFLYKFRKPGRCFRTLAFLLFDHIAGLDTVFYTLMSGGALILTRRRDPRSIAGLIEAYRVEVLPTSPSFLRLLCVSAKDFTHDLSSLKVITYGSEPMDPATLAKVNALFPHAQITQKYGTTETGSPRTVSRGNESVWLKFQSDGFESKVVDDVLWIRSESTLLGYLNAPSPVDEEGWYCTSDLVDVDGPWIRFRGRVSDTINVGGEKVVPAEVEHCILELDFVCEAVVRGEPHSMLGQIVTARVGLANPDLNPKAVTTSIWQHCRRRLAPHKAPVKVEIVAGGLTDDRQKARRRRDAS
jgi:long-chain acyl-CoA synthetase